MLPDINALHAAAIWAGLSGDLRGLVSMAGAVAQRVRRGHDAPTEARWLWDPRPVLRCPGNSHVGPPLALGGPELLAIWSREQEEGGTEVSAWLAAALARAYSLDYSRSVLCQEDQQANEGALKHGSRLLFTAPWFGSDDGGDLWVWVEAAHGEDPRFRRVSCCHRNDY